jgi:NAD(P)-dependent dehydrogenase (short-subunit alcohol dehydrogenase family)
VSRTALVTGAGSGIGRAISVALLDAGWDVVLVGRHSEPLSATAAGSIGGGQATVITADVTAEESVEQLFAAVDQRLGRLDLLVNNAGAFGPVGAIDVVSLADWQATLDVNLTGSWLCARAAFALMKRQTPRGGRIINNGSLSAHTPRPESAAYTATKHAITGLTKSLSLDGRGFDIACGQIDIGNASTQMTVAASTGMRQADGSVAAEPTIDVRHVAESVVHMASLPLGANISSLTIMATAMPFVGRG